jgi:predicted nucleotidyltransferase
LILALLFCKLQILLIQGFLVLNAIRVFCDAIDWANFYTLGQVVMPYAFGTQSRVDDVNLFALGNSPIWALRLADIAVDTFIIDYQ